MCTAQLCLLLCGSMRSAIIMVACLALGACDERGAVRRGDTADGGGPLADDDGIDGSLTDGGGTNACDDHRGGGPTRDGAGIDGCPEVADDCYPFAPPRLGLTCHGCCCCCCEITSEGATRCLCKRQGQDIVISQVF